MRKVYFHNDKSIDQNINTKRLSEVQQVSEKQVVDINKLLNRVKIDQKNETKRKIIFYSSTVLKEEPIVVTAAETYQPAFSPDGKEVAFLEERVILKVNNLATKETRTILEKKYNYSYSDGDQTYEWSPDGKWFLVVYLPYNRWNGDVGLASADGKRLINLTESGYECYKPKWMMGGEAIIWFSGRHGMKSHGSWGSESDAYAMFLTQSSYDKFNLTESEHKQFKEAEDKKKKEKEMILEAVTEEKTIVIKEKSDECKDCTNE